jgi:hypothetical protein
MIKVIGNLKVVTKDKTLKHDYSLSTYNSLIRKLFPIEEMFDFFDKTIKKNEELGVDLINLIYDAFPVLFTSVYIYDPNNTYSVDIFCTWLKHDGLKKI